MSCRAGPLVLIIVLIALVLLAACVRDHPAANVKSPVTRTLIIENIDDVPSMFSDGVVGKYNFISSLAPRWPDPYYARVGMPVKNLFFKEHRLYDLGDGHSGLSFPVNTLIVAIKGRDAYLISGDVIGWGRTQNFNAVVAGEKIAINDRSTALLYAEFYIKCAILFEKRADIISGIKDVEGISDKDRKRFRGIDGPKVTQAGGKFKVEAFTWRSVGGCINKWNLDIRPNGLLEVRNQQVGRQVGAYDLW